VMKKVTLVPATREICSYTRCTTRLEEAAESVSTLGARRAAAWPLTGDRPPRGLGMGFALLARPPSRHTLIERRSGLPCFRPIPTARLRRG
jgi:hypothetical protein